MKKFLIVILSAAMVLSSAVSGISAPAFAASAETDLNMVTRAGYLFKQIDTLMYSDDMFRGDARELNRHLATASFDANYTTYQADTRLVSYFEDNGFSDIENNGEWEGKSGLYGIGVSCAHKKIEAKGKTYTLVAVMTRSGTNGEEWGSLVSMSGNLTDSGNYYAMQVCSDKILDYTKSYIASNGIKGDVKLWVTGYSRSAGASNLAAAEIVKHPRLSLGVNVRPEDLYCYLTGTVRSAAEKNIERDLAKGYDFSCIHNVYSKQDGVLLIPSEGFRFDRYGETVELTDSDRKERMLELLRYQSESSYDKFMDSGDPDAFRPYKLDIEKLLNGGGMEFVEDSDSYIGYDQTTFFKAVFSNLDSALARNSSSGNSREGYAKTYQEPAIRFLDRALGKGLISTDDISGAAPLIVSLYALFVTDKMANDANANLNEAAEKAFNSLAYLVEDSNGNGKKEYRMIEKAYDDALNGLFTVSESYDGQSDADASVENPPQKYVLKRGIGTDKTLLSQAVRRVAAKMYAKTIGDMLKNAGAEQADIDALTSDEDSSAMSYLMAQIMFGNSLQSKASANDLSFDNQYFKSTATMMKNFSRMASYHISTYIVPWLRAQDPYYDDYVLPDAVQQTGYRRVYIDAPSEISVSGTLRDAAGNAAATFRNGAITSRTDKWIGATVYDGGWWLRVPAGQDHKVEFRLSGDAAVNIKVADYSASDGKVIRDVESDSAYDWRELQLRSADVMTLNIPAAQAVDDGYDLTKAAYSLSIKRGSVSVPKVSGLKVKAASKALKISWTKLPASKRAAFDKTEIQYSTSKKFAKGTVKTKSVSKTKTSYKVRSLKKGKKYYVRVRNVKYSDGKKYASKWSTVKTVKTK